MKTTSLKTIYLSKDELKSAIVSFISKSDKDLAAHMRKNTCEMQWNNDGSEFVVSIDNEVKDKAQSGGHGMSRILRVAEKVMDQHGTTLDRILDTIEGRGSISKKN